jgi:hypothetical protein
MSVGWKDRLGEHLLVNAVVVVELDSAIDHSLVIVIDIQDVVANDVVIAILAAELTINGILTTKLLIQSTKLILTAFNYNPSNES